MTTKPALWNMPFMKTRRLAATLLTCLALTAAAGDKGSAVVKIDGKFYSTPIVTTDGNVVIASHNKTIYLFNSSGELQNSFTAGGWIHATPRQLSNGQIAFGCYDKYFYFLDKDGNFVALVDYAGQATVNFAMGEWEENEDKRR